MLACGRRKRLAVVALASCVFASAACEAVLGLGNVRFDGAGGSASGVGGTSGTTSAMGGAGPTPATSSSSMITGSGGGGVCTPGTVVECYGGPPETRDVGPCRAGKATCELDGESLGPCEGEVLPAHELCGDGLDDNCDGLEECAGQTVMSTSDGPPASGALYHVTAVAQDSAANIVIVGTFSSELTLAGETLVAAKPAPDGGETRVDGYIAKFDAGGKALWAKRFGDVRVDRAYAVAVDSADNIYVGGTFTGTIDFGSQATRLTTDPPDAELPDGFIVKLAPDGSPLKAIALGDGGTNNFCDVLALDVGPDDSVVAAGAFSGELHFPAESLAGWGFMSGFVAKLSSDLEPHWGLPIAGGNYDAVVAVDVGPTGDIAIAMHCTMPLSFPNGKGAPCGGGGKFVDIGVVRLSPAGSAQWVRVFQGTQGNWASGIAVGRNNDVFLSGALLSGITIDGESYPDLDGKVDWKDPYDGLLVALDGGSGNTRWHHKFGDGAGHQSVAGVEVDDAGGLYVAGYFLGEMELGGEKLPPSTSNRVFLARLNPDTGAPIWLHQFGGAAGALVGALGFAFVNAPVGRPIARARGTRGGVALGIRSASTIDLGDKPLNDGIVVARFAP